MRLWSAALVVSIFAAPLPAAGQVWRGDPGPSQADIHRYRLEEQRLRSTEQAAFAQQQRLNSRLTRLEVDAARQPAPETPLARSSPQPGSSGDITAARSHRDAVASRVGEIDQWLDRDPR